MKNQKEESKPIFRTLYELKTFLNISEIGRVSNSNLIGKMRTLPHGGKLTAPERERVRKTLNHIAHTLISNGFTGELSITTEENAVYSKA